jgi:hypothetical protein
MAARAPELSWAFRPARSICARRSIFSAFDSSLEFRWGKAGDTPLAER